MIKSKYYIFLCCCFIILAGCWDSINIEERGFIIGAALDIKSEEDVKQPEITITNQMVIPAGIAFPSQGGGGGGEKAFLNFSSTGNSIFKMEEEIAASSSKAPYYEHLAVLVISKDVAEKEHLFSKLLDTYIRDVNLRRGIKVVVSEGEAKELLNFTTPDNKLPAINIEELLKKSSKQVGFLKPKTVGDIEESHLRKASFVLPYLQIKEFLEHKSGAVFHGSKDKMVGIFRDEEMSGLEMVEGEHTTKVIDFIYKDDTFVLKVIRLESGMKVDPKNIDEINVTIDIEIEGIVKEAFNQEDLTNSTKLDAIQKAASEEVEKMVEKAIKKGQEELGANVFKVWQELETKHYDTWKKVRNDWEEGEYYYKKVNFDVNVLTEVYSVGTTNRTR